MANAANVKTPAANTAAVYTMDAVAGRRNTIAAVVYSYSANPTGGNLKIESPSGTTIFETDIIAGGQYRIDFPFNSVQSAVGDALIVTLAAGGSGISGKLSVLKPRTEV